MPKMTPDSSKDEYIFHHKNNCLLQILYLFIFLMFLSGGQFQDSGIVFSLPEEQGIGSFVGSVSTNTALNIVDKDKRPNLRYTIFSDDNDNSDLFKIDSISGNISVAKRIDRETVCPLSRFCEINFGITVTGHNNFFMSIPVKVNILDINDNIPRFQEPSKILIHISEDSPENFSKSLPIAIDADSSVEFGITSYIIDPQHDQFRLDVTRNFGGISRVSLVLLQKLDREVLDSYRLVVVAADGGRPQRSGTLVVDVVVDDVNDNSPKFSEKFYSANITEEAETGYQIVVVSASDDDVGANGQVVYALSSVESGNSIDIMDKVTVNSSTGIVTLKQRLVNGEYRCLIDAHDLGSPRRYDQTAVLITVLDTINSQPTVRISQLQKDNLPLGWVSEGSEIGTVLAVVSADDVDTGHNAIVSCESQDLHFKLDRLDSKRYKLVLALPLDREVNARYTAQIICHDQGIPSLNSTASMDINVSDVNDNIPEFRHLPYVYTIVENNLKDDTVALVNAVDNDEGKSGEVEYRLANDLENFSITPDTGIIKASRSFDREELAQYHFQVLAVDHGEPRLTGTAIVTVNILDVNDVNPIFSQPRYQFNLIENSPPGSSVGKVTVTDSDLGDGGVISLCLRDLKEKDGVPLAINNDGTITSLVQFDRERTELLNFYVIANDNGSQRRSSSALIAVQILDVNDNRPVFAFPGYNFSTYINVPIKQDTAIIKVDVYDKDYGQNAAITYAIITSNASERFRVEKFSGDVVASKDLTSFDDVGTYFVTINATDQGTPSMWETRTFQIILQSESASSTDVIADRNMLIVVCIVCFTVIVSGVVLITICLVRKQDRRKKMRYHGSCCPGNQPDLDIQIAEQNSLRCSLETDTTKCQPSMLDPTPQPQQDLHKLNSNYHGSNFSTTDQSFVYSLETNSKIHSQRKMGHSLAPSSQRQILETGRRQDDFPSVASTETCTGDSGHGSDEDMSNSMEQTITQVDNCFLNSATNITPNFVGSNRNTTRYLESKQYDLRSPVSRTSSSSLTFDLQVKNTQSSQHHLWAHKHQFVNPSLGLSSSLSQKQQYQQQQRQACTTFRLGQKLPNRFPLQQRFYQDTAPSLLQQHHKQSHVTGYTPQQQRTSSLSQSSSIGDSYNDDSDLNTTTSGSYSLRSDTTINLSSPGEPKLRDVHV